MTARRSTAIVEVLRGRILRGLQAGTLAAGDRLPSARELVGEFNVDHRLILAAYRELADDGLLEIRERGGVYLAATSATRPGSPPLPVSWFAETLTDAFAHEIAGPELHEWLRRSIDTLRLRAVVISTTDEQVVGLARELREDFGLLADGVVAAALGDPASWPPVVRRADVIVATASHVQRANEVGGELGKPVVPIEVRPDLIVGEWALLLRHPVWAVVAMAEFGDMLKRTFAGVRGAENLHVLVHGRDDLSVIPEHAPTYVTQRARAALGDTPIRGRVLPPARTISVDSARDLFTFIVRANLEAMRAVHSS